METSKIINTNIYFIELLAEEGKELYNEEMDLSTHRVTAPLGTDLSMWVERDKIIEENDNTGL